LGHLSGDPLPGEIERGARCHFPANLQQGDLNMDTGQPRFDARITAQERVGALLDARIVELSQDMAAKFKEHAAYHV
jgi:hypothetical protein